MKEMRLGRSWGSTLPVCEALLLTLSRLKLWFCSKESRAGWVGSSLMCNGNRRTRLPNGAIFNVLNTDAGRE